MFTKLNTVDNQPVYTNLIECRHDDVISDVTLDRFPLELLDKFTSDVHQTLYG